MTDIDIKLISDNLELADGIWLEEKGIETVLTKVIYLDWDNICFGFSIGRLYANGLDDTI